MNEKKSKTNRDDWLTLGFRVLALEGAEQLKAEVLARKMGKTKGSFYWHFLDIDAFKSEMMRFWRAKAFSDILAIVDPIEDFHERIETLIDLATQDLMQQLGVQNIEPSIRAWGRSSGKVALVIEEVDQLRINWLSDQFRETGVDGDQVATLFYSSFIGLNFLSALSPRDRNLMLKQFLRKILSGKI